MAFLLDHSKKLLLALLIVLTISILLFKKTANKNDRNPEDEIAFEHSLMIGDKKIIGYRSPASMRRETLRREKEKEKSGKKDESPINDRDNNFEGASANVNKNSGRGQENLWGPADANRPADYQNINNSAKKDNNQQSSAKDGRAVMGPLYGGFNKAAPSGSTPTPVEESPNTPAATPVIKGAIKPLQGLVTQNSSNVFMSSAYANTCTDARLLLLDLTQMSILLDNPIEEETISSNTRFEFDPVALNLSLNTPNRYMLQTIGCLVNYQRIISSFYESQDLDQTTTLISKIINTRIASSVGMVQGFSLQNLYLVVQDTVDESDSFETVYSKIELSPSLNQAFQNTFNGGATQELKEAAPDITNVTLHKSIKEKTSYTYNVTAAHWDSDYVLAYEWQVNGVTQATTSSWNYIPPANSAEFHEISLITGHKNSGDSLVDRTKPYHKIDVEVTIENLYPSIAPTFNIAAPSTTPTLNRTIDLGVSTGILSGGFYDQCETFSDFAIKEDAAIPSGSDFIYTCTSGPVQSLTYNILKSGDGPVALHLYSRDIEGRISTLPWNINVVVDTTAPAMAFKDIQASYIADSTATIEWTLTEEHSSSSQDFTLEFYNGTSWSTLPVVPLTDGPHSAAVFSTTFQFPDINASGAKFKITYADTLGQQTIVESSAFPILRSALSSTPLNLDFGSILNTNQTSAFSLDINNTGLAATPVCSAPVIAGTHAANFIVFTDGCNGVAIASGASCPLTLKATPSAKGTRSGTISIACGGVTYSTSLTLNSLNNPPVVATTTTHTTPEDTAFTINFGPVSDVDGDSSSYSFVTSPSRGAISNCLVVSGNYTCTYTPNLNDNGADTFTFKSNDGTVDSNTGTVNITILPANDAPTLTATQTVSTAEDTAVAFSLNAGNDVDGNTLSYIIVSNPAQGTLSCTGGTSTACTYTPPANFNGSTSFTYKVNDGSVDSAAATVTVNVSGTNDPPVIGADQSVTTTEDTAVAFTLNTATDIDLPAQTLSYKLISAPTKGALSGCINTSTYELSRNCTFTPTLNANGSDSFTYRAYDSVTDSSSVATVSITITAQNDAPVVATTQSVSTAEDTAITFALTAGTDTESDPLTYIRITSTSNGTINCTGGTSRSCTYTPAANYNGSDTFTYKVNDGTSDSNVSTVTITVTPVNDPPVMAANQTFTSNDNTNLLITLSAASDIDGGALSYKIVTTPSNGTVSNCITTGSYGTDLVCDYISSVNFNGSDSFTFIAYDTFTDATSVGTVTINVSDITAAPAPAITLASNQYTNTTATTFTASSCNDTPSLFVNEGSAPAAGAAGWQSCILTAGGITYTMGTAQGAHTVKVWSKDSYGNVSTTSTNFTIYYDTVIPAMSLTTPPAQKGGASYSFAWTATESYTTTSLNFSVEAFNGTSWSSVGTTPSTSGPLSGTSFTRTATVPSVDTTNAAFRVTFTDRAGNSNTVTSSSFIIDSTPPATTITSPAANSYHLSSATITGACEIGRTVDFSGDIQTSFSIACTTGSYTQLVNFSNGDGNKSINVSQTDAVGNVTSLSRNLIRDELSPIMTRTSGTSPFFTRNDTPNAWGGSCEGNYTIYVTGSETTNFNCTAGSWSWTPSAQTVDGVFTYNLAQTDAAGNTSSPPLSLSWERDATPPEFNISAPLTAAAGASVSITNNSNFITFNGNCEDTNTITISGGASQSISCSSSSWEWTTPTYTVDGTRTFTFTQADSAGNTSPISVSWTRDTTGPGLNLALNLKKTNTDTVTFNGTCEPGVTVEVTGAETQSIPCPAGTWSFVSGSFTTDGTMNFTFTQTFTSAPFNATSTSGQWIRETDLPTVSAFTTTAPNPTKSSFIPVNVTATSQNPSVHVSHLCIRPDDTTKPAVTHPCFIAINSPEIGQALAQVLSISNYSTLVGWTPKTYDLYLFVKDEAGNISNLTSSGNGTISTDQINITYDPGIAPMVWNVLAANVSNPPLPPTRAQSEVPAGSDVYIRWSASDNFALPAGAISLYYTENEIDFNTIVTGLDNADYGCGETLAANQGCYRWTGGSPFNTSYKIRVRVTDSTSISTQLISNPLNLGFLKIIAGNTESGLGGSAQTAMFFTKRHGDQPDSGTLVVSKDGTFYFADNKRGILTIDQDDGKQKIFIRATGVSSGDGGPAVNATLQHAHKITLDYQNRLLIHDRDRIRRVDLRSSTPTIETIIGGGADQSDTVNDPRQVYMNPHDPNDWWNQTMVFFAMPNGDIYFQSDYAFKEHHQPTFRLRYYQEATRKVFAKHVTGLGNAIDPAQDISKCRLLNFGLRFNTSNSSLTGATLHNWYENGWPGCSASGNIVRVHIDPITFAATGNNDDGYRWWHYQHYTGMDGNLYIIVSRHYIMRMNFDGTYTRILGEGTKGECADGTAATSCLIDIQNFFVSTNGKMYFTDRGVIRTVDSSGNVKTLFGQKLSYGHNVNALNARMSDVTRAYQLNNGKVVVNDRGGNYIKEFTMEGNINIIAGDGAARNINLATSADAQSVLEADYIVVDKVTGDLYGPYLHHGYGSYAKMNRTSGLWEHIIGDLAGGTHFTAADGVLGLNVEAVQSEYSRGLPMAFDNNQLVLARMRHNYTDKRWEDNMIKSYNALDGFRQSHLTGVLGWPADNNDRNFCDASSPVAAATCEMPHWDTTRHFQWDPVLGRWITAIIYGGGSEREVYEIYPDGNIKKIVTTPNAIHDSFLFRWESGQEILYYCNGSRIRKVNITTQMDLGDLPWSMPNMSCRGITMSYNATNNSIVFPFEQNGLNGVAEYYLP